MGEKSRRGDHEQALGPWVAQWMRFIEEERQKRWVAPECPHGFQSAADLEEAWVGLVTGMDLEHHR